MRVPLVAVLLAPLALGSGALGDAGSQSCASAGDAIREEERQSVDDAIQQEDRQLVAPSLALLQLRAAAATPEQGEGEPGAPRQRRAGGEASAAAGLRSAANATWTSYYEDPTCRHPEVGEGHTCVPNPHGHSNSYVYCSAHRRTSPTVTYCETKMGPKSRCVKHKSWGLQTDYCDNPFCRNGGAYAGDGTYCKDGVLFDCQGGEDVAKDDCSDHTESCAGGEHRTWYRSCHGGHNRAHCVDGGSSSCS